MSQEINEHEVAHAAEEAERVNILVLAGATQELIDLGEFMNDEALDTAMHYVVKLIAKPDVPVAKVPALLVELQAISAKMQLMAAYYQNVGKDTKRKNAYNSAYHAIDKLVDAMKFLIKGRI